MTFAELHSNLRALVPPEVRLHVQLGIQSSLPHRLPVAGRANELELQIEIGVMAFLDGMSAYIDGVSAHEVLERFRAVVLPALGLGPGVSAVAERLTAIDCDLSDISAAQRAS